MQESGKENIILKKNAAETLFSSYIIQFSTKILSVLSQLIIARFFLSVEEYGIFLLVFFIFSIVNNIRDFGISSQIVRKKDINYNLLHSLFLIISIIITIGQLIYSLYIYKEKPIFSATLMLMSLSYIPTAISSAPSIYFLQNLIIRQTIFSRVFSIFGYFVFSIIFSFLKFGPQGLALAKLAQSIIFCSLIWHGFKKHINIKISLRGSLKLIKDSYVFFINDNLGLITAEISTPVINEYLGAAALAIYRAAYSLIDIPVKIVEQAFFKVAYPLFSKLIDDKEKLLDSYAHLTILIMVIETPIYAFIFFNDKLLIFLTYGQKYADSAILIKYLALLPIFTPLTTFGIELIKALRKDKLLLLYIFIGSFFIIVFSFILTSHFGAQGMAVANYLGLNYIIVYYFIFKNYRKHFFYIIKYMFVIYFCSFIPLYFVSLILCRFYIIDYTIEKLTAFTKIYSLSLAVKIHDLSIRSDLISSGILQLFTLAVIFYVFYFIIFRKFKRRVFG